MNFFSEEIQEVSYSEQHQVAQGEALKRNERIKIIESKCRQFIRQWRHGETFIYRDQLKSHYRQGQYDLEIDFTDIVAFDKQLSDQIVDTPNEIISIFENAALEVIAETILPPPKKTDLQPIQIQLTHFERHESLRNLRSKHISKLVCVPGIIISTYKVQSKATQIAIKCSNCYKTLTLPCPLGFGTVPIPRQCPSPLQDSSDNKCGLDPFVIMADNSRFVDTQKFRLQELPEDVPTGEMPRHISLSADRNLCNKVTPGTRLNVIGIYSIFQSQVNRAVGAGKGAGTRSKQRKESVRFPYIRVIGFQAISDQMSIIGRGTYLMSEEEELVALSRDPDIYEKLAQSLAPKIYGHDDVKKAIVCLLFGGTRKFLPSGIRLRGDLNILLLGDPSVAKSQLLKCTAKSAPIAVYTSGKGNSAAGLTASVIRDSQGEFHLEGGAMILADGGCVCIDEFDKMREDDRVAIHEAMEQQTISIAKAGITTILNSRTSVLAAANPTFGRYDDLKKTSENIDFETTILSRFDLIFIIRDKRNSERDALLASHVVSVHMQKESDTNLPEIEPELLTKYIAFCRQTCRPHLSPEAAELLRNQYVGFRLETKRRHDEFGIGTIPITVRQLEAVVRISESLAKMELSQIATVKHVTEALRLFRIATVAAAQFDSGSGSRQYSNQESGRGEDFDHKVQKAERHLKRRIPIGAKMSYMKVLKEMLARDHQESAVRHAIENMKKRGEFDSRMQGRQIFRKF